MQRARGPWWAALVLLAPSVIAACDRDEGDTATSSDDEAAEDASAGSDDSDSSDADGGDEDVPTCADLECPAGQVCVQPRPYCDESTEPPELRLDPAYCQPVVSPPRATVDGELVLSSGVAMCEDPELLQGPHGQSVVVCPDVELPCG